MARGGRIVVWTVLGVGFAGLTLYAAIGDTGPVGWLNAAQQQATGRYSQRLSALILVGAAAILATPLLIWLMSDDVRKEMAGEPRSKPATITAGGIGGRRPGLFFFAAILSLTALVWAAALGWAAFDLHRRSADTGARYAPVDLEAGGPAPAGEDHLALRGRLLWERVVAKRRSGLTTPEEELVPVVGPHWQPGRPVAYVARFERLDPKPERDWRIGGSKDAGPVLVRLAGSVPDAATPVFQKMGVPLAEQAQLVVWVPSAGGVPAEAHGLDWQTVGIRGAIGTGCVILVFGSLGLAGIVERRRARRAARRG